MVFRSGFVVASDLTQVQKKKKNLYQKLLYINNYTKLSTENLPIENVLTFYL